MAGEGQRGGGMGFVVNPATVFLGNGVGKQGAGVRAADDEREDKRGNLPFHGVYMLLVSVKWRELYSGNCMQATAFSGNAMTLVFFVLYAWFFAAEILGCLPNVSFLRQ